MKQIIYLLVGAIIGCWLANTIFRPSDKSDDDPDTNIPKTHRTTIKSEFGLPDTAFLEPTNLDSLKKPGIAIVGRKTFKKIIAYIETRGVKDKYSYTYSFHDHHGNAITFEITTDAYRDQHERLSILTTGYLKNGQQHTDFFCYTIEQEKICAFTGYRDIARTEALFGYQEFLQKIN